MPETYSLTSEEEVIHEIQSSGDLPDPGIKPWSPALQADSLPPELQQKPRHTGLPLRKK